MKQRKQCFGSPGLFCNSLYCRERGKSQGINYLFHSGSQISEIKCKSVIYLISRHNLISVDLEWRLLMRMALFSSEHQGRSLKLRLHQDLINICLHLGADWRP